MCVYVCMSVCVCVANPPQSLKWKEFLVAASVYTSAMASSQPQVLEISTPEAHYCLQDADVNLVCLPADGYITQDCWEQGQLGLRGPSRA